MAESCEANVRGTGETDSRDYSTGSRETIDNKAKDASFVGYTPKVSAAVSLRSPDATAVRRTGQHLRRASCGMTHAPRTRFVRRA